MSKTITMPTRVKPSAEIDNWVETREAPEPPKTTVKPKRLTIDIDPTLHRELKISCAQRGVQIADLLRALIEQDLRTQQTDPSETAPDFP